MRISDKFKLEKIDSVISSLNLDRKNCSTEFLNLNKCITYCNKKNFILKFNFDKNFLNFSNNEISGYKNSNNLSKIYNIPKYETLINSEEIHVAKIEYLEKKKGNYFNCNKFIKGIDDKKKNYLKTNVNAYLSKIKKKYETVLTLDDKKKINYEINLFLNKEGEFILPINISHGDFVHWNTRIYKSKYYCYDLEQYDEERLYCYDVIHWYFMPFFQKIKFLKSNLIKKKLTSFFDLYLQKILKTNFSDFRSEDYYKFFYLYLVEKKMYYLMLNNSNNIIEKTSSNYYSQLIYLSKIIQEVIDNFLNVNE